MTHSRRPILLVAVILLASAAVAAHAASCEGQVFAAGTDPLDPASVPIATFDCSYLESFLYQRVPVP